MNGMDNKTMEKNEFNEFEDPAKAWIDLCTVAKMADNERCKDLVLQAAKSNWTHGLWDQATAADGSGSETDSYDDDEEEDEMQASEGHGQARTRVTARAADWVCFKCGEQPCTCKNMAAKDWNYCEQCQGPCTCGLVEK